MLQLEQVDSVNTSSLTEKVEERVKEQKQDQTPTVQLLKRVGKGATGTLLCETSFF
jgi:hypothetical protein